MFDMSDGASAGGVPDPVPPDELEAGLTETELVADIWSADARAARYAAQLAASVAALARRRRAERDRDFGPKAGPGPDSRAHAPDALADVSETFVTELALIRQCTEAEAESLAVESVLLTTKLSATWAELYAGRIDARKMRALVELLGPVRDAVAAEIERRVLPGASANTVPQLRARVRRLLARLAPEELEERRQQARKHADVRSYPTGDDMGQLAVDLPLPESAACFAAIDRYAQLMRLDGDPRPIGMIRAAVARDLILRPWEPRPPVTAVLTIHAAVSALRPGGTEPAEVNGEMVTAAQCRELLEQLDMLGVRPAPAGGCVQVAIGDPATGRLRAVATRRALRRAAGGTRRRRRSRPAPEPAAAAGPGPDGAGLRPPAPTTAYRPTAEQRSFVQTRDRCCRMPGCRRRPGRCDIDHGRPHADGGPTDCWNLASC